MRLRWAGRAPGPAAAVVGVWDPVTPAHAELVGDLVRHARSGGLGAVAVLIDPAPSSAGGFGLRYGTHGWPVYDDVPARISLLGDLGLDAVLVARFAARDFSATAADFLDRLRTTLDLRELWVGAVQNLGPGAAGGTAAITRYAERCGIALHLLGRPPVAPADVRTLLAAGRIVEASAMTTRPPTWRRPASGALTLAWRSGRYRAAALDRPGREPSGPKFDVVLDEREGAPTVLRWPDPRVRYLAFTRGPADLEGRAS